MRAYLTYKKFQCWSSYCSLLLSDRFVSALRAHGRLVGLWCPALRNVGWAGRFSFFAKVLWQRLLSLLQIQNLFTFFQIYKGWNSGVICKIINNKNVFRSLSVSGFEICVKLKWIANQFYKLFSFNFVEINNLFKIIIIHLNRVDFLIIKVFI